MVAPNFIDSGTGGAHGTSASATIPLTATAGDRLVVVGSFVGSGVPDGDPTGLTQVQVAATGTNSSGRLYVWTGVVTSGGDLDPGATITVTSGVTLRMAMAILVYEPSDVIDSAIDASNGGARSSGTTPTASTLSEATAVHLYGVNTHSSGSAPTSSVAWTPDVNTTERVDYYFAASARFGTVMAADEVQAVGTSTGRTASVLVSDDGGDGRCQIQTAVVLLGTVVDRPVANAGTNQTVQAEATVNLDGTASDGGGAGSPYTYQWTQTSGTAVTLDDDTAEDPSFTAPSGSATLVFQLVVTDSASVASEPDTVTITVLGPEDTALPNSDETVAGWTPSTGSTSWEVLSDNSDSTYTTSPGDPSSEVIRVGLSSLTPAAGTDVVRLSVRVSRENASSASCSLDLIEGASTVIASSGPHAIASGSVQQFDLTLSEAEINSIADFGDLDVRVTVTAAA